MNKREKYEKAYIIEEIIWVLKWLNTDDIERAKRTIRLLASEIQLRQ